MTASAVRQTFYGVAAVVGLAGTWLFNLRFFGGDSGLGYLEAWFANDSSSSAAVDLIVLALVLSVFVLVEGRRVGVRRPWLFVLVGWVGAMAFAVPLFLLLRERAMRDGVGPRPPTRTRP